MKKPDKDFALNAKGPDTIPEAEFSYFGQQLKAIRKEFHMSLDALTQELTKFNIHVQRSTISRWENGLTAPNIHQFFALCRLFELEDGVRYFSGPLHKGENTLNEIGMKKLNAYRQDLLASGLYDTAPHKTDASTEVTMRLYSFPVSAGTGTFPVGADYEMVDFKASIVPPKADYALKVRGDSMTPNFQDGQIVWVQQCQTVQPGEIGIFLLNGEAFMKMYDESLPSDEEMDRYISDDGSLQSRVSLLSLNTIYDPIVILPGDDLLVLGKVLTQ